MNEKELLTNPDILRELIMDHYQYPHHHILVSDDSYRSLHMASESCIDDITVQTKIEDGRFKDIRFDGVACTISTASTSMMTDLLIGKTLDEARVIVDNYFQMVSGKEYDADLLEEAVAMKNVYKQANRIKCATIGWNAVKQVLDESEAA
ncbi:MAG: SUF system NifU family Fe-S cluster assembly protein [Solobacterium sp.]|nr:SUF system NifU family Fe-S cluster assembly protein [Solobacterium sp.]